MLEIITEIRNYITNLCIHNGIFCCQLSYCCKALLSLSVIQCLQERQHNSRIKERERKKIHIHCYIIYSLTRIYLNVLLLWSSPISLRYNSPRTSMTEDAMTSGISAHAWRYSWDTERGEWPHEMCNVMVRFQAREEGSINMSKKTNLRCLINHQMLDYFWYYCLKKSIMSLKILTSSSSLFFLLTCISVDNAKC